jgi:hypothetical protein
MLSGTLLEVSVPQLAPSQQRDSPGVHWVCVVHAPFTHVVPGQTLPQLPQLLGSDCKVTQVLEPGTPGAGVVPEQVTHES